MSQLMSETDVVVVGGGPAGATTATLIAQRGHRVLLLERERFPRYQIGESLLPATVHGIGHLLGVDEQLKRAGFVVKHGGVFRWGRDPEPWTFEFALSRRTAGPTSYAYQVERMKFDQILLNNARAHGVTVREESPVVDLIVEQDQVYGVRYRDRDHRDRFVRARYVVDSGGGTSQLHRRAGLRREYSEHFQNLALFGYYRGGTRLPEPNAGNILCVAFEHGWFWYIPITPLLTSVGAVVNRDMAKLIQGDPEQAMRRLIDSCPMIRDNLATASRVTEGPYGELRVRKDWSYTTNRFHAPGLALVGDAACFIDPVFSSGVHLATYGGLQAARAINSCLSEDVNEAASFAEFERRYRREYQVFHDFLVGFYDTGGSMDSYFWQARKVSNTANTAAESFVNLVGGVSAEEWMAGVHGAVLAEGTALQAAAHFGPSAANFGRRSAPGELTVSADQLSWQHTNAHDDERALVAAFG
jgi:FAD-dependent halogenase